MSCLEYYIKLLSIGLSSSFHPLFRNLINQIPGRPGSKKKRSLDHLAYKVATCNPVIKMAPWTFPFVRVPTSQNFVCIVIELMLNDDQGSYRVLNSWKSLEICPVIFQTRKSLENRDDVRKRMKKSWVFFQRYNKCFISEFFFVFVKSYLSLLICLQHTTKKAFVPAF